jgi:alpha-tubulin suppressor-like RCC1 family protein
LSGVIEVALGAGHTCARLSDGSVRCWGANDRGQLGDGSTQDRKTPVRVTPLGEIKQIATGGAHTCALLAGDQVACWGANGAGQLGDGDTKDRAVPAPVNL